MENTINDKIYTQLDIGNEQVTSNECWYDLENIEIGLSREYQDFNIGDEQVTSNECYDMEE